MICMLSSLDVAQAKLHHSVGEYSLQKAQAPARTEKNVTPDSPLDESVLCGRSDHRSRCPIRRIDAMKLGAFDYLLKPLDVEQLQGLVAQALQISRLMQVPAVIADEEPAP